MVQIKTGIRKTLGFYAVLWIPLASITCLAVYLVLFTNLPQLVYSRAVVNIYFDCLALVDQDYVYSAKPGPCILNNLEYRTVLHHDRQGFRNTDTGNALQADMVLLGDSHAHGFGVNGDQTFAAILESRYGRKAKNLGMGSYATLRELAALQAHGSGEKVVVIQYCDNDAEENLQSFRIGPESFKTMVRQRWLQVAGHYRLQKEQGAWLVVRELARRLLRLQFQSKQAFAAQPLQRDIASEADAFAQLLARFEKVLQGKRLVIFESSGHGFNHPEFKLAFQSALKKHNPALDAVVLDSTGFLGAKDYYFLDEHLNVSGHARVAEQLNAALLPN